MQLGIAVR